MLISEHAGEIASDTGSVVGGVVTSSRISGAIETGGAGRTRKVSAAAATNVAKARPVAANQMTRACFGVGGGKFMRRLSL